MTHTPFASGRALRQARPNDDTWCVGLPSMWGSLQSLDILWWTPLEVSMGSLTETAIALFTFVPLLTICRAPIILLTVLPASRVALSLGWAAHARHKVGGHHIRRLQSSCHLKDHGGEVWLGHVYASVGWTAIQCWLLAPACTRASNIGIDSPCQGQAH